MVGRGGAGEKIARSIKLNQNVRRVSGENMATALDDDVASLLAGLDGPETSQVQHWEVKSDRRNSGGTLRQKETKRRQTES